MIDPGSLALAASASFAAVKKGISLGKDLQSMYTEISRWMSDCHEIERSHEKEKKSLFKRSVEVEALETYAAAQKIKRDREQLRLYMLSINPNAWNDFLRVEGQVRKRRQELEAAARRRRRKIIEIISIVILLVVLGAGLWLLVWWALHLRGLL